MMQIKPSYVAGVGLLGALALFGRSSSEPTRSESPGKCPICGESVDPRGLNGHLRFGHDLDADEARQVTSSGEAMEVTTG